MSSDDDPKQRLRVRVLCAEDGANWFVEDLGGTGFPQLANHRISLTGTEPRVEWLSLSFDRLASQRYSVP